MEEYEYEIHYKRGILNSNVDALTRMYAIQGIKDESYEQFLEKIETQLITNNNVKETIGTLIESPKEYNIVSEIARQYNFRTGINYQLKKQFGNGEILPHSKVIGDTPYYKQENRFIIFLVTKNRDRQKSTYENMYISLMNLKLLCEENKLTKLAMNKLGEHDDLEWEKIRSMLRYIFRKTGIEIIICTGIEYTEEEKLIILKQFHDSKLGGHLGINKTVKRIKSQFIWKGMKSDVKKYIRNCTSCQVNKVSNRHIKQPMAITSTSSQPFEKIFLDIVGPLPTTLSNNIYILTMEDDLTRYTLGVPIPDQKANTVAEAFVTHFVCVHGIPGTILTDQGTNFLSKTFAEVCKLLKIEKVNTSPFRPQGNPVERAHRTLAEYLRHYVDKNLNNWDHLLPFAFFVYNSTVHTSTNFQPYALVYGRTLEVPIKLKAEPEPRYNYDDYLFDLKENMQISHKIAREQLIKNKIKSKERYDRNENPQEIHVKDLVLLKDNNHRTKLDPIWLGPYEVTAVLGNENVIIKRGRREITVHRNNIKKYYKDVEVE